MTAQTKLKILLVTHGLPPESVGGVEQHVEGLARALVAEGHTVEIWSRTGRPDHDQGTTVGERGGPCPVTRVVYRYEGLDSLRDLYRVPVLDRAFDAFVGDRDFDVAHVHHLTGLSLGCIDVLRARGIPTVLTLHDYWLMCPRGQMWHRDGHVCEQVEPQQCATCLEPAFGQWVGGGRGREATAAVHADAVATLASVGRVVVPSARALPPWAALGIDTDAVRVVGNGVDTAALGRLPPVSPGDPDAPLRVGALGTLIPTKGLDVLLDAVARLPAGTATLSVHGNAVPYHGDESYLTRAFARLTPASAVSYHGPYASDDLPAILEPLQVVAAPARWNEVFGLTVREAMAAGRPAIVSRIGGLQDAVEDGVTGLVVPPDDPAALARALARLAADRPLLGRMAEASRRAGIRGFDAMATELLTVYREIAGSPGQQHP